MTLDGQPLARATVGFTCTDTAAETPKPPPAFGVTDDSGMYRMTSVGGQNLRGVCVGTFVVTVSKFETEKYETGEGGVVIGPPPKVIRIVPEVYGDIATSPLRATVRRGENKGPDYDFALESKAVKKP